MQQPTCGACRRMRMEFGDDESPGLARRDILARKEQTLHRLHHLYAAAFEGSWKALSTCFNIEFAGIVVFAISGLCNAAFLFGAMVACTVAAVHGNGPSTLLLACVTLAEMGLACAMTSGIVAWQTAASVRRAFVKMPRVNAPLVLGDTQRLIACLDGTHVDDPAEREILHH